MSLKRVLMTMARNPGFPNGDSRYGYEFIAPLTPDGRLDAGAWEAVEAKCTVRHFEPGKDDENGMLVLDEDRWFFDYNQDFDADDEPLFKLDKHIMLEGEYITVTEHDRKQRAFQIVSVRPA
mgnify:CR=1 FL=1